MRLPASYTPHAAVILAIDPGRASGWAAFRSGELVASGAAKTHGERLGAALRATLEASAHGLPLVVVGEKWTPGGKFAGARTMAGLGAQWGLWLATLEQAEIPKSRAIRVHTQTWRAVVLGGGFGVKTSEWDARAQRRATAEANRPVTDDNEADAICVGLWSIRAGEVALKLPKPRQPRTKKAKAA